MNSLSDPLNQRHLETAILTRGISEVPIHNAVLAALREKGFSGDVLDFGAGNCLLAETLLASGAFASVTAVDILEPPPRLSPGIRHARGDLNDRTVFPDGSFDRIVSVEVIEHLENPRATMREWFRLVRPGGWVVLSTPNNESWRSLLSFLTRGHFAGFFGASYPAHITALLPLDVERAATEAGFSHAAFRYSNHGHVPKLGSLTWQRISGGLLKGKRHSDNMIALLHKAPR